MANGSAGDLKRAAHGVLQSLKDNLPKNCELSVEREDEVVINALTRHDLHLSTHAIDQNHLDPFKLACWIGCEIIKALEDTSYHQHETVFDALVDTLEEFLVLETNRAVLLQRDDRELLKRLFMAELKGNGEHGIGFNGLFIAFHCLRATYNQLKGK